MLTLDEVLKAHQEIGRLRRIEMAITMGHSRIYAAVIVFGSYGAFFTLWVGVKALVPEWAVLISGIMIGASVVSFILFEIVQVYDISVKAFEESAINKITDPVKFSEAYDDRIRMALAEQSAGKKFWQATYWISVVAGFGGAIVLITGMIFAGWSVLGLPT